MSSRLRLHVLATGSSGNCSVIEDAITGDCIAIDCGICKREFLSRCQQQGVDPAKIQAFLVTHAHSDHTSGLGVALRGLAKIGCSPIVFAHKTTVEESSPLKKLLGAFSLEDFEPGQTFEVSDFTVLPFETSHDTQTSFGFRIEFHGEAIGFMTDTGIVTKQAAQSLKGCRILALEANHDEKMLAEGPYPYWLKQRIASERGHLSNSQHAVFLESVIWPGLEHVVAMHASENNNTYQLALEAAASTLLAAGHNATAAVGYQDRAVSVG